MPNQNQSRAQRITMNLLRKYNFHLSIRPRATVAQWLEHCSRKAGVASSNLVSGFVFVNLSVISHWFHWKNLLKTWFQCYVEMLPNFLRFRTPVLLDKYLNCAYQCSTSAITTHYRFLKHTLIPNCINPCQSNFSSNLSSWNSNMYSNEQNFLPVPSGYQVWRRLDGQARMSNWDNFYVTTTNLYVFARWNYF